MKIQCPHCGETVTIRGLGRKAFNVPVNKVCDTLQSQRSVSAAADSLSVSRGYVYKVLKNAGMTAKDFK